MQNKKTASDQQPDMVMMAEKATDTENPWVAPNVIHPKIISGVSWNDDADKLRSEVRTASSLNQQKRDPQIP